MLFRFYCDESHDSTNEKKVAGSPTFEPKSYVVGGFFGNQKTWEKVELRWRRKNSLEGVERFHAAHLNAGTWEYDDWTKARRIRYSKEMLRILKDQRNNLHGVSCGLYVDAYRRIISPEGQVKMGHPYLVCFKAVVAMIAKQMDDGGFSAEDTFAVIIDRGEFAADAVKVFYGMKNDPKFRYRHRLEICSPEDSKCIIGLQPADFVAYETFKLIHGKRNGTIQIRKALATMFGTTGFMGCLFDDDTLNRLKRGIDDATCIPDGMVVIPDMVPQ